MAVRSGQPSASLTGRDQSPCWHQSILIQWRLRVRTEQAVGEVKIVRPSQASLSSHKACPPLPNIDHRACTGLHSRFSLRNPFLWRITHSLLERLRFKCWPPSGNGRKVQHLQILLADRSPIKHDTAPLTKPSITQYQSPSRHCLLPDLRQRARRHLSPSQNFPRADPLQAFLVE